MGWGAGAGPVSVLVFVVRSPEIHRCGRPRPCLRVAPYLAPARSVLTEVTRTRGPDPPLLVRLLFVGQAGTPGTPSHPCRLCVTTTVGPSKVVGREVNPCHLGPSTPEVSDIGEGVCP